MAEKLHREKHLKFTTQRNIFTYIILFFGAVISLIPFFWMISTSLMSLGEALGITFIPSEIHFENYVEAWRRADFTEYFVNSILITLITLAGQLTFSVLAAYAFARMEFPGRDLIPNGIPGAGSYFCRDAEHNVYPGDGLHHPQFLNRHLAWKDWSDSLDQ
jgi:ABC-type glycerol-3-phosphate transport system permease component